MTVTLLFWQVQVCVQLIDGTDPKFARASRISEVALGVVLCYKLDIIWTVGTGA